MGVHYANNVQIVNRYQKMDRDDMQFGFDKARRIFNKYVWPYLATPDSDKELKEMRRFHAMATIDNFIIDHQDDPCKYLGFALKNMIEGE